MSKYLWTVSYSAEGARGLIKDGAAGRPAIVKGLVGAAGGAVEAFYFAFGTEDAILIVDLPSNVDAAAVSLAVSASGAVSVRTTTLLTIEEADAAAVKARAFTYRPPGA